MNENDKEQRDLKHFLFPDQMIGQGVSDQLHKASSAEQVCRLKYRVEKETKDLYLQVNSDQILVINNNYPECKQIVFKINRSEAENMCLQLLDHDDVKRSDSEEFPALLMSKQRFEKIKSNAHSTAFHKLVECLSAETGDNVYSIPLAQVLKCYVAEGEIRLCTSSASGWDFQNAAYISDHSTGWLLRMSCDCSKDWMIALPMTKAELHGSVTDWILQRFLVSR